MPELPEVERFRRLLLPLISSTHKLSLKVEFDKAPRKFLSETNVAAIHDKCYCVSNVVRRGKLLCMVLDAPKQKQLYLYIHMGMTGRISTSNEMLKLESQAPNRSYPPPWTCLVFQAGETQACFSDPRKFGSVTLSRQGDFDHAKLAPDALEASKEKSDTTITGLAHQSTCIKAILLDQNRVMSGVGNWIADEVLYQSRIHPQQIHLNVKEAELLLEKLHVILQTAIDCLDSQQEYPREDWLFHYRWKKKNSTDCQGRAIAFIKVAGRTSAVVPSLQTLMGRKRAAADESAKRKAPKRTKPKEAGSKTEAKKRKKQEEPASATKANHNVRRSKRLSR